MRIWSLLPSATEILFALGLDDEIAGVTHECDWPAAAALKPRVTVSYIDSGQSSGDIDRKVTQRFRRGLRLYGVDEGRLRLEPPDLIVTQDLCPVCAVSPTDFSEHLKSCGASVLTLNPHLLEDIFESIRQVGEATGRQSEADACVRALGSRVDAIRRAVGGRRKRRVLCLEWLDPPIPAGHWVPDMVEAAGGCGGQVEPGEPSRKLPWDQIPAGEAEVIVLMPCGFSPLRTAQEAPVLWGLEGWSQLPAVQAGEVWCVDGNAHFSRPGPRVVDGIEILAGILHPDAWPHRPEGVLKLRPASRTFEEWN